MRSSNSTQENITSNFIYFAMLPLHLAALMLIYIEYLALGKTIEFLTDQDKFIEQLNTKAKKDGIAVEPIGPALIPLLNIASVVPGANQPLDTNTTKTFTDLLDAFEEQQNGRRHVGVLSKIARQDGGRTIADATISENAISMRNAIKPLSSDVVGFLALSRDLFKNALDSWSKNQDGFLLGYEVKHFIHDLVAERFFGQKLTPEEHTLISKCTLEVRKAILDFNPFTSRTTVSNAQRIFTQLSQTIIDNRKEKILSAYQQNNNANIFAEMIRIKIADNYKLKPEELLHDSSVRWCVFMATIADGVFANTTAILLQLANNKIVKDKLVAELTEYSKNHGEFTEDTLKKSSSLPYLDAVVKEGLRHTSSVAFIARYTPSGIKTDHYQLPPRTLTIFNLFAMHHNKDAWGEDADVFNPERFMNAENAHKHPIGRVPFMPFSGGKRQCIGSNVAIIEMKYLIIELLRSFDITLAPGQASPKTTDERPIGSDPGENCRVILHRRPLAEHNSTLEHHTASDAALAAISSPTM